MTSPAFQTAGENSGSSSAPTITEPPSAVEGNLLIAVLGNEDPGTAITGLTGWTELGEGDDTQGNRFWYGWIIRGASAPDLVAAAANTQWAASCIRIDGHDPTTPIGTDHGTANGDSTAPDPPSVDPGSSRDHLSVIAAVQEGKGTTRFTDNVPTGYTERTDIGTTGGGPQTAHVGTTIATRTYTGQAENPAAFASSVDNGWIAITIIVRPAAAAPASLIIPNRPLRALIGR